MRNKQHNNNETLEMTKEIRISISIKRNRIPDQERRSKLYYNFKRIRTKILIFNTYKIRKTIIYKRLSRRLTS